MAHLKRNAIIVILTLLAALWASLPLSEKLSFAKDLAGGTTMVYQVQLRPGDPADTVPRMIELLKGRVDPNGVLDITMVQQGSNRIEVSMPLAGAAVKERREVFEAALADLGRGAVSAEALDRTMRLPADERAAELARLAAGDAERLRLLQAALAAFDASLTEAQKFAQVRADLEQNVALAQAQLEAAEQRAGAPGPGEDAGVARQAVDAARERLNRAYAALDEAAGPVAAADEAYEQARQAALATSVSTAEVRRALQLPARAGRAGLTSPRERAIQRLKEAHPAATARIDEVVARWNAYEQNRRTLDDPADLKRLLRGAGVLEFRIAPTPGALADEATIRQEFRRLGPRAARSAEGRWFRLNKLESWVETDDDYKLIFEQTAAYFAERSRLVAELFDGEPYVLLYDIPGRRLTQAEGAWRVEQALGGSDTLGRPAIDFVMDPIGGVKMGELTRNNLGQPMAILLDDQIYTAPNIQGEIRDRGQITGTFSNEEIAYVKKVLGAGSLAAKLSPDPVSESTIAPELGVDNLRRGLAAGMISFVLVAAFMVGYYFFNGVIAVVALLVNVVLLVGLMALNHAAFSLPGIAGVILTFGMAVDANVLIYERLREELQRGNDLRTGVRLAYSKALAAIVDGNMTNLLACVVLYIFGTVEVRGFAVTMSLGVLTTLFAQLFVTRVIYSLFVDVFRWRRVSMLPMAVPAIQRALALQVDWLRKRPAFLTAGVVMSVAAAGLIGVRGEEMLDNEFRGGTKVTIQLKADASGQPIRMTREQVEDRIKAVARDATAADSTFAPELRRSVAALASGLEVLVVNPERDDRTRASRFTIKTVVADSAAVQQAVVAAFPEELDIQPVVAFAGSTLEGRQAPVRALNVPVLAENLADLVTDRPQLVPRTAVGDFLGGAAILLRDLSPPVSLVSLEERVRQIRNQPDFAATSARESRWIVLEGDERAVKSALYLVREDGLSSLTDERRWASDLRDVEWRLVRSALAQATSLAGVESFSASVANTFATRAAVASLLATLLIIIYVWVRFASFRYALAAIVATLHDCLIAVGMLALCEIIYERSPTIAAVLGFTPFKIDLNGVAAVLTVLGYSLNDKIVVMDRIRENRGKLPYLGYQLVNDSINQTFSRTIMTGGTALMASIVLYALAGESIRPFAFLFIVGLIVGTYSSIALGAMLVYRRSEDPTMGGTAPVRPSDGAATTVRTTA